MFKLKKKKHKKQPTIHNTHKILMCLQNYLIFYLEVIPPLSSFIALYMTKVGEQRQMRPSWWLGGGSVYGLTLARQQSPGSPPILAPPPPPGQLVPFRVCSSPARFVFSIVLPNTDFIVVLSEREGPFREAMISEWAANATLARAGALTLIGPRLQLSISSQGPCSLSSGSLTFKGQKEL